MVGIADVNRVGLLIDAAFQRDECFTDMLEAAAALTGSRGAAIMPLRPSTFEHAFTRSLAGAAEDYGRQPDFRFAAVGKMLRTGIAVDQDIVTPDRMARMSFYNQYLSRHGLKWFAAIPFQDGEQRWALTFQRAPDEGAFEQEEQDLLRKLGCRLSQSVSVARRVATARNYGVIEGLRLAGRTALLLNRSAQLIDVQDDWPEHLRRDLRLAVGQVILQGTSIGREIKARVDQLLSLRPSHDDPVRHPIVVNRIDSPPVYLRLRAFVRSESKWFDDAAVLVLVDEPRLLAAPMTGDLEDLFGLTSGQATVARLIASGHTIKSTARELGVGVETVRTTLQRVFRKINVSRQAELVRIVAALSKDI